MRIVIALGGNALLRRGGSEPASIATLLGILVLSIGLDYGWKHGHPSRSGPVQVGP